MQTNTSFSRILAFSTKGTGSNDEQRLKMLVQNLEAVLLPFNKSKKISSFFGVISQLGRYRKQLIVMEGTGIAGGIACLLSRVFFGHRYVVSSGDAVGPFVGAHLMVLGIPFGIYERVLCKFASGFIGWTPYLVGRAMTFGTRYGVTAPGWVIGGNDCSIETNRSEARKQWGVLDDCIVYGLAGSLIWNRRRQYCYGLELIRAIRKTNRSDIAVVVIGDGSGYDKLRQEAGDDFGKRIFLPGRVPLDQVMKNICGMDVASLPQSVDAVGAFRYTTKISEYKEANLPIVTSRIPAAYDLDLENCWRLPGLSPWDPVFVDALADVMAKTSIGDIERFRKTTLDTRDRTFCKDTQVLRVTKFLEELLDTLSR